MQELIRKNLIDKITLNSKATKSEDVSLNNQLASIKQQLSELSDNSVSQISVVKKKLDDYIQYNEVNIDNLIKVMSNLSAQIASMLHKSVTVASSVISSLATLHSSATTAEVQMI